MADFPSAELIDALPRLIFLGVIMTAFGYAAGNARQLTGWKVGLLLIVVIMFLEQFNHGKAALFTMFGAFLVGYLLPQAHALEGFGRSISEVINNLRYRSAYADIQRELERAEQLRREYEAMQKEQLREKAEAERERRRQQSRSGRTTGNQSNGQSSGQDGGRPSNDGSARDAGSGRRRRRSSTDDGRKPGSGRSKRRSSSTSGNGSNSSSNNYKRTKHQKSGSDSGDGRSRSSTGNGQQSNRSQQRSTGNQSPPNVPPALNALRDKYLDEIGLVSGQDYLKAEIKKAYRRMAIKCHPDKHQGKPQAIIDQMADQFRRVTIAYDWLYVRAPS